MSQGPKTPFQPASIDVADSASPSTAEQSLPPASAEIEPDQSLGWWMGASNWVSTALICLFLVVAPTCAWTVWEQERGHRTCPADWMLWAVGSDRNANEAIADAIEKSRKESPFFKDGDEPKIKGFDFDKPLEFGLDGLNFSDSVLYKPDE